MSKNASFFMLVCTAYLVPMCYLELADRVKSLGGKKLLLVTDKGMTQLGSPSK